MTDNNLIFAVALLRGLAVLAAIGGGVYLAYHDKNGWGWLIFLAVCLGSYSIKADSDKHRVEVAEQAVDTNRKD